MNAMPFSVEVDEKDIQEIEDRLDDLTKYMFSKYVNFGAVALMISAIIEKVELTKEAIKNGEANGN